VRHVSLIVVENSFVIINISGMLKEKIESIKKRATEEFLGSGESKKLYEAKRRGSRDDIRNLKRSMISTRPTIDFKTYSKTMASQITLTRKGTNWFVFINC
jgi:hypothetical protein